ncbi:MAG: hypothetical protein NC400_06025 [Clostridium sp.]|nr:hypothetical protein [Clostridium sp.]
MFTIFYEHRLLTGLISAFLLSGILCQMISGLAYQKLISESDNMSATENKQLKQCKQKYASYYKLNGKMVNTEVFVDRFLQKVCLFKIQLNKLAHISGQLVMLSILMAGISVCLLLSAGSTLFQIMPYYLVSILGMYLYFSISGIVDTEEKKKILRTNLTDYLDNHFVPRLETEKENAMEEGVKKREKYAVEFLKEEETEEKAAGARERKLQPEGPYQDELEDLLEEFFA